MSGPRCRKSAAKRWRPVLSGACSKFRRRFSYLEEQVLQSGRKLADLTLAQMDAIWDEGKAKGL